MLQRLVGYAYPWDYAGDPAAAPRAAALGLGSVAVAASYHATRRHPAPPRASHPRCGARRVLRAGQGAGLARASPRPRRPSLGPRWRLVRQCPGQLLGQGLEVEAWIVLTHNSMLGRAHPDLVVGNAFGDRYPTRCAPPRRMCRSTA